MTTPRGDIDRFFELSLDLMVIANGEGHFVRINPAFETTLGYSREDLTARPFMDFIHPDDLKPTQEAYAVQATGSEVVGFENRYRCKDGSYRWLLWSATAIKDGLIYATARDVTERKQMEASLRKSAAELARSAELSRSNAELEQFASVASHDLQEPLRKVQTFAAQLTATEHDRLSAQGQDFLRRMSDAAGRMRTLIDDLLMFSRVSTQGRAFVPVDLGEIVEQVLVDLELSITDSGARVSVDALPRVEADPVQMRQLLQNLLGNALKFHRDGIVPELRVSAEVGDHLAELTIQDNGIGFDEQYATRIFGAFERLHGARAYPGTGIGLALCRKIVERHHGTITAESEVGHGARFTVRLPVEQATEGAAVTPLFPETIDQEASHALV